MTFLPLGGWETKLVTNLKSTWVTYWVSDWPELNSMTSVSIEKTKSWDQFIISANCIQRFSPTGCCSPWSTPAGSFQGCIWWVVVTVDFSLELSNVWWVFYGRVGFMLCFTSQDGLWDRVSGKLGGHQHGRCLWVRLSAQGLIWLTVWNW